MKAIHLHVLLSLLQGERHGYGIVKDLEVQTNGRVRMEPGNLYRVLRRLLEEGLIREAARQPTPESGDKRRRYYGITAEGRVALTEEIARLKALVASAESTLAAVPAERRG